MPVFTTGEIRSGARPQIEYASLAARDWCEVEYYDIVNLPTDSTYEFERIGKREKLFVCDGACKVAVGGTNETAETEAVFELDDEDGRFTVEAIREDTTLVRVAGDWADETGKSGIFTIRLGQPSKYEGDPVSYPKETRFDSHYHDCDEYWIMVEGRGVVVSEDRFYEIGPGDCLATGMGHHHDLAMVYQEPFRGVFFETTLEGEKRRGHLWEHTHGPAEPKLDRV